MAKIDQEYHELLNTILKNGFKYEDPNRKSVNRIQIPSYQFKHDFKDGFPAVTTKKLYWKGVVGELLWFLRGDTNIKYLVNKGINIWNKDAYNYYLKKCNEQNLERILSFKLFISYIKNSKNINELSLDSILNSEKDSLHSLIPKNYVLGDLGKVYGHQLRNFGGKFDQLKWIIDIMISNPMATKKTVSFINPNDKQYQALSPCHTGFKILTQPLSVKERLNIQDLSNITEWISTYSKKDEHTLLDQHNIPKYKFVLQWEQDSVDTFLGLPFNIASYALLAHIIGKMTNMVPKSIVGDLSNVHIYEPHLKAVEEQLSRSTSIFNSKCDLLINDNTKDILKTYSSQKEFSLDKILDQLEIKDFSLSEHTELGPIKAEMLAYNK